MCVGTSACARQWVSKCACACGCVGERERASEKCISDKLSSILFQIFSPTVSNEMRGNFCV